MLLKKQIEKMEIIFNKNKKNKVKPTNLTELAKELGTTRQNIYNALNNKSIPTQEKIVRWLEQQNDKIDLTLCLDTSKENRLYLYGFEKIGGTYQSTIHKSSNKTTYCLIIDKGMLSIYITRDKTNGEENGIWEDYITNIGVLYDMIKDGVLVKKEM